MKGTQIKKYFFPAIVAISLIFTIFFRFLNLGDTPAGLTKDESYYGYDAYSVMNTGRDIWGEKLPLFFKSTGEYKLNLTYLMIPAIKVFGLSEFAIRLPSAVFGLLTLIIFYLTLRKLTFSNYLALTLTLILALSPWSFGMSRLFYESNVGLSFVAVGIYFLLSKRPLVASTVLALASYLYSPYRYIGFGILLAGIFITKLSTKTRIKTLALFVLVMLPLLMSGPRGTSFNRLNEELLLQKTGYELTINEKRANCHLIVNNPVVTKACYLFWNKGTLHLTNTSSSVLKMLSPSALFLSADSPYFLPPGYGMYLSYLTPFYLLGMIWLLGFTRRAKNTRSLRLLIIAGIAISVSVVSATGNIEFYRHPVLMYLIFILIAFGFRYFLEFLKTRSTLIRYLVLSAITLLGIFQTGKYLASYFTYTPTLPLLFSSDVHEVFDYLEEHRDYQYLVDKIYHGPITAAFQWKIDPAYYQGNVVWSGPDKWGFDNAAKLDNIYSQGFTLDDLLCLKHASPDTPLRALIVENPGRYNQAAALLTHDFSGSLTLHAVYDIDLLYPYVLENYPADLCTISEVE